MTSEYDELLARLDRLANYYGSPTRVEPNAAAAIRALTAKVVELTTSVRVNYGLYTSATEDLDAAEVQVVERDAVIEALKGGQDA